MAKKAHIEELKTKGALQALRDRIDINISTITHRTFSSYHAGSYYSCLREKLNAVRTLCDQTEELLDEVHEMDGKSA